jgi:hypothetical protein
MKTTDAGLTWTDVSPTTNAINAIFFLNENLGYAVGNYRNILKYSDSSVEISKEPDYKTSLTVIPNPVADNFRIILPQPDQPAHLTLFNICGKRVLEQFLPDRNAIINIAFLPAGIYFARVQMGEQVVTVKIIRK